MSSLGGDFVMPKQLIAKNNFKKNNSKKEKPSFEQSIQKIGKLFLPCKKFNKELTAG